MDYASLSQFALTVVYVFLLGIVLAILEIQIEGRDGWAASLPTWRPKEHSRLSKMVYRFTKKDVTGYHAAMFSFVFMIFHLPAVWNWQWSIQDEFMILAFFFTFASTWDFLWFVLNPHYSLNEFRREIIWWHRVWIGRVPVDYLYSLLFVCLFFVPGIQANPAYGSTQLALLLGINLFLTLLTIAVYPYAFQKGNDHDESA